MPRGHVFCCLSFEVAVSTKDASDIVLHDDNFSSVVKGMEQGPCAKLT